MPQTKHCGLLSFSHIFHFTRTFTHSFDCDVFLGSRFTGAGWPFWCSIVYSLAVNLTQLILTSRTVVARISFALRWNVTCPSDALRHSRIGQADKLVCWSESHPDLRISLCASGGECVASLVADGPPFVPFLHHPREY